MERSVSTPPSSAKSATTTSNNVPLAFRIYQMLEQAEKESFDHVVGWQSDGRSFKVRNTKLFEELILPRYFPKGIKYKSFQRQLNVYCFQKVPTGPNKGGMMHKNLIRGQPNLLPLILRKEKEDDSLSSGRGGGSVGRSSPRTAVDVASDSSLPLQMGSLDGTWKQQQQQQQQLYQQKVLHPISLQDSEVRVRSDLIFSVGNEGIEGISDSDDKCDGSDGVGPTNRNTSSPSHAMLAMLLGDGPLESEVSSEHHSAHAGGVGTSFDTSEFEGFLKSMSSDALIAKDENSTTQQQQQQQPQEDENDELGADETSFPFKLHLMLENAERDGHSHIVSWVKNGTAFKVNNYEAFVDQVLPNYFDQSKYESFRRQLSVYGFNRISGGADRGVISHSLMVAGQRWQCRGIKRKPGGPRADRRPSGPQAESSDPNVLGMED